jgi:hypothetical protein
MGDAMGRILGGLAIGAVAALPLLAYAQGALTYRCVGSDGKKYYGSAIPMQCAGRLVEVLNSSGLVVKRIDPEKEERDRQAKLAKEGKSPTQQTPQERDEERRNRALLATYTSVKDVEDARGRALRDNAQQAGRFEQRINELQQRKARYVKELDNYKRDGKASRTLEDNIKNVELEIAAQESLVQQKKAEIPGINARYDEDLRRYKQLTELDPSGRAKALGMEKGVTVKGQSGSRYDEQRNQYDAQRRAAQERSELQRLENERENERRRAEYQRRLQQQR